MDSLVNALNDALGWLADALGVQGNLVVNVLVLLVVLAVVAYYVREEIRKGQWSRMTPEQRRERIREVLDEAWRYAEWIYSNIEPTFLNKELVAADKKDAAVTYAKRELRAMGATSPDLNTVPTRLELVCAEHKPGGRRYRQT